MRWISAVVLGVSMWAGAARAYDGIPKKACQPISAYLVPGVVGLAYWPAEAGRGPWLGGGVQVAPVVWSRNTNKFGPGQGKVIFDVGLLGSDDEDAAGKM